MASYLINCIPGIENKSYLELGVAAGDNFRAVQSRQKTSVDVAAPATYMMTTDAFFNVLPAEVRFDVIYIDACHEFFQVVRDFNNSVQHLSESGVLFAHDLIPGNAMETAPHICGDAFKLLDFCIMHPHEAPDFYSLSPDQGDYGLTFFLKPRVISPSQSQKDRTYEEFMVSLAAVRLYSREELQTILRSL